MSWRGEDMGTRTWMALTGVLVAGCTSMHKTVAFRHTDCPYKQIEISDETYAADEETWIARCGERTYQCRTRNVNNKIKYGCRPVSSATVAATEAAGAPGAPTAAADAGAAQGAAVMGASGGATTAASPVADAGAAASAPSPSTDASAPATP